VWTCLTPAKIIVAVGKSIIVSAKNCFDDVETVVRM